MPRTSETDEFSEKFQGGGSFSIQKFMLQIFAIIDDTSVMNFRKFLQHNCPKMSGGEGGSKAVWNFSENSSVLEGECVPYLLVDHTRILITLSVIQGDPKRL